MLVFGKRFDKGFDAAVAGLRSLAPVLACALSLVLAGAVPGAALADEDFAIANIGAAVAQRYDEMVGGQAQKPSAEAYAGESKAAGDAEASIDQGSLVKAVAQRTRELQIEGDSQALLPDADYTSNVGELWQNDIMVAGCELVSLEIAMESMGIEVNLDSIVSDYLNMDGSFAYGYAGDPYWMGGGFAPGITAAANGYLEDVGSAVRAHDLTGSSFDVLSDYVAHGYPVLVWTTMGFEDPLYSGQFEDDAEWYDNEHCVVLYGIEGETAYVSDPLEGYVERDLSRFIDLYEQCGSRAVVLR